MKCETDDFARDKFDEWFGEQNITAFLIDDVWEDVSKLKDLKSSGTIL